MTHSAHTALIVGCGYVGQRLAKALLPTHRVAATVRSETSRETLRLLGVDNATLDLDKVAPAHIPRFFTENAWLFYLAPPQPSGLSDQRLDRFLRLIDASPAVFVYMSTTGVYGNTDGCDVDESTQIQPQTERAHRRVSAEAMVRVWCHENQVRRVVLRVAGIYGPGRLPLDQLQRGEAVVRPDEAALNNRIHVDDLVSVCTAVASQVEARGVYNVTDGHATTAAEFTQCVAKLAGLSSPPQISMDEARVTFSASRLSFLEESRRVSNRRLLNDLQLQLRYSNYEEGIRASLKEGSGEHSG
jgi:nucleoside-diphosphate-sugar epimerase